MNQTILYIAFGIILVGAMVYFNDAQKSAQKFNSRIKGIEDSVAHIAESASKKICLNCHKTVGKELQKCSCGCTEFRAY